MMQMKGIKELGRSLKRLSRSRVSNADLEAVATEFKKDVEPRVPNDKGELLASWNTYLTGNDGYFGFDAEHGSYQNQGRRKDGTRVIRNRPAGGETYFMQNTLENNRDKYAKILGQSFFESNIKFGE